MFRRNKGVSGAAAEALDGISPYADQLARDETLRRRLLAALGAALAAQERARRQAGLVGAASRLGSDPVLRAQLAEALAQLQKAKGRVKRNRSHRTRNVVLVLTGAGAAVAVFPRVRAAVARMRSARDENWVSNTVQAAKHPAPTTIEQEIEVEVPVSTAYNQWTQFEEFPSFMEGVDEVRQLDDTLLHWAATVAGKKAEWDAKIVEQKPDRRIAWQSVDGKQTSGAVTFEPAGSPSRTLVRLHMSYTPDGVTEKVGSAAGLDARRVRGDLERFRDLIEERKVASGAWRGEIEGGEIQGGEVKAGSATRAPGANGG
jgi:uncharacterized membrane protein